MMTVKSDPHLEQLALVAPQWPIEDALTGEPIEAPARRLSDGSYEVAVFELEPEHEQREAFERDGRARVEIDGVMLELRKVRRRVEPIENFAHFLTEFPGHRGHRIRPEPTVDMRLRATCECGERLSVSFTEAAMALKARAEAEKKA